MSAASWQAAWFGAARRITASKVWRGVESQYASATTLLVESYEEHDLLEQMLEESKPPAPGTAGLKKHFLLVTPFRYMPAHGSRFRRAGRRGIWYGALALKAACAEVAWWRMRFIVDSAGLAGKKIITRHTFFASAVDGRGIDLMAPPWGALRSSWIAESYAETQRLAQEAEAAGVELIRYESARAPGLACIAAFTPDALKEPKGGLDATRQQWVCTATASHVMMQSDEGGALRFEWGR